jgi:hypothetical protein
MAFLSLHLSYLISEFPIWSTKDFGNRWFTVSVVGVTILVRRHLGTLARYLSEAFDTALFIIRSTSGFDWTDSLL